jgi:ABC-type sugar transport system ATPase subunit
LTPPILEISGVSKDYHALRPLRIEHLTVIAGEHVALRGLDQTMAVLFVNLITGATLPDRGEIQASGDRRQQSARRPTG